MNTDTIIALIRFLRKLGVIDLYKRLRNSTPALIALIFLIGLGGYMVFAGGGGGAPDSTDVRATTNVTIIENNNSTVTFTYASGDAEAIRLTGIGDDAILLSELGQSHTAPVNATVTITAIGADGDEVLLNTYEVSNNSSEDDTPTFSANITATPQSAPPEADITFTANESTLPENATNVTYGWEFGDGGNTTGETVTHAYAETGEYTTTLTITANGSEKTATTTVSIGNEAPYASINGDDTGRTGKTFTFDATEASDPDGDALSYQWDFGDGTTATGETVTHAFANVTTYEVELTVTDRWGETDTATHEVTILNQGPTASADIPESTDVGAAVAFDGSDSSDPDNQALTYEWDFGDGATASGANTQHTYDSSGTYTVRLYVTDESGATDLSRALISVEATGNGGGGGDGGGGDEPDNYEPTAVISAPAEGQTGQPIDFGATDSFDPDNGDSLTYEWSFGDGTSSTGATATHTYEESSSYTVMLTVSDGNKSDTDTQTISLKNSAPTARATANETTTSTSIPVEFNASSSTDVNGDSLTYEWDFDDGTTATGAVVEHSYTDSGLYEATVTVTDDSGETDTADISIRVENQPPDADAYVSEQTTTIGTGLEFNAVNSSDPDGDAIVSYDWNFADGNTTTGETTTHAYASPGTYDVTLSVTDEKGATGTDTVTITVENQPPTARATANETTVYVNDAVAFDASNSSDPDGHDLSYEWTVNDTTTQGATLTHTFESPGTYDAQVTVTDTEGGTATETIQVTVENREPNLALRYTNPDNVYVNETLNFDASNSSDPDGDSLQYVWNFNNGPGFAGDPVQNTSYEDPGTYEVWLTVSDPHGAENTTTVPITIENRAPSADLIANTTTVTTGESIEFDASGSTEPDGQEVRYTWDFADGTTAMNTTDSVRTHSYSSTGTYLVNVTVSDGDLSDSATVEITVE